MGRSNRRARDTPRPLFGGALQYEQRQGASWAVRSVSGAAAAKTYRCPGCNQEVRPGVPHVVTWPAEEPEGTVERRHWHTACWRRGI